MSQAPVSPPPWYRHAPYQLFFPLGGLLGFVGVLPWGLFALGVASGWRPGLHALTQVESFLTAFVVGFLFTFIPRRTKSAPPATWEVVGALALVLAVPALGLLVSEPAAHLAWALLALGLGLFVARRIPGARRQGVAVAQLLWFPVSFALGVLGALLLATGGLGRLQLLQVGGALVWQGLLSGLVVGVGGMLLPMLLHREAHRGSNARSAWLLHGLAAAMFAASFALEAGGLLRAGYAVRGLVTGALVVGAARLWRWPQAEGLHRRLAWFACWLLPLGFLAVALWPEDRSALLHLTFIGGFGLLTLTVANHVIVAHGGRDPLLFARPAALWVLGLAFAGALAARLLVALEPAQLRLWLALAFVLFTLGLVAWGTWVGPKVRPARGG